MHDSRYDSGFTCEFRDEDSFREAAADMEVVIADPMLRRAVPGFKGEWIDFPHYAVSGSAKW